MRTTLMQQPNFDNAITGQLKALLILSTMKGASFSKMCDSQALV